MAEEPGKSGLNLRIQSGEEGCGTEANGGPNVINLSTATEEEIAEFAGEVSGVVTGIMTDLMEQLKDGTLDLEQLKEQYESGTLDLEQPTTPDVPDCRPPGAKHLS